MQKTAERNLIVRTGKSEAEVTDDKESDRRSRHSTVDRHGLSATAELLILHCL